MMQFIPRTRSGDPITSHLAEEYVREKGLISIQQEAVLTFLEERPGSTAKELQHFADAWLADGICHRRLRELVRLGRVREGEIRKCRVGGRKSLTWWPVEQKNV